MAQILVRSLDRAVVERLKKRAKTEGRSLQSEVKAILEQAARIDVGEAVELSRRIRGKLAGRALADSADLIREDRNR